MNVIFQCDHHLGAITNAVKADSHKHWMLQLFICAEDTLDIVVEGTRVSCKAVVVDMDTAHQFGTGGRTHCTMLIDPVSAIARRLRSGYIRERHFYVLPDDAAQALQEQLVRLIDNVTPVGLAQLIGQIDQFFSPNSPMPDFDERVASVLALLNGCSCEEKHQLRRLAEAVSLSESRLAHLFRAETGVPLKSYLVLHELQKAYAVLARGGSVTEAALVAGFNSPSHLAYTNRKMTGMSASGIMKDSEFLKVSFS